MARKILTEHYDVDIAEMAQLPGVNEIKNDTFDIILTDPFQQGTDFEEFVSEVRTLYPRIPIVFITKTREPESIIKGFRMGITDYLFKPFQEDDFKRMFQRAIFALHSSQSPALEGIFQVCQQLNLCRSIDRFFYILVLFIAKILTSKKAIVFFKAPGKDQRFELLQSIGLSREAEKAIQQSLIQKPDWLMQKREAITLIDHGDMPPPMEMVVGEQEKFVFVILGNDAIGKGVLGFDMGPRSREFIVPVVPKIEELLKESRIIFSNLMEFLKAREIALKDDLTDLYNMRSFQRLMEKELREADKGKYPVSVLFMDIDDFKMVNDTYGHLIGSKILQEVAEILKKNLRKGELIFRYGGDEFVVVLPATNQEQAKQIGERIRSGIASHPFQSCERENIRLTVSMGVATYPDQTKSFKELLETADKAMYHGKKGTKNVVYVAGESKKTS